MKSRSRTVLFSLLTLFVFTFSLFSPTVAFADDGVPPETPPVEAPPPEVPPESLPEVLEQAPPDTQVVVVNSDGEVEPLVTVEAAEIIQANDPIWCPATQTSPTPGANGCTTSYTTMTELINWLEYDAIINNVNHGPGTIWIQSGTLGDSSTVVIDSYLSTLTDLTVQGGWSGAAGDTTYGAPSVFTTPLRVFSESNLVLNNITLDVDDPYAALAVNVGTANVSDISVANASGPGAYLTSTLGDTTVTNSTFDDNARDGLNVVSLGNITVDNVSASGNIDPTDPTAAITGASLNSCFYDSSTGLCAGSGSINVVNSTFNGNSWSGLVTDSGGDTTLTNVTAEGNLGAGGGAYITGADADGTGDVLIFTGSFLNNGNGSGLDILSDGNVELNGVTANGNNIGASIDATLGTGSVTVIGGQFNDNDWDGLDVWSGGDIAVSNVVISDNSRPGLDTYGAYLDATAGIGEIQVTDSTFNNNDGYGLFGIANNNVTLTHVNVNGGGITDDGALIKSINGTARVIGGTFTNNTKSGLIAIGGALMNLVAVDLVDVSVIANLGDGARVYSTFTYACFGDTGILVNVNDGDFSGNSGPGLVIKPGPDGTVTVSGFQTFDAPDALVIDLGNPCLDKEEEKPEGKPVNIVEVPFKDGDPVQQDCATYSGTLLMLPDGTWVKFGCPFEGSVSLEGLLEEELPGSLGAGAEFVSAVSYAMTSPDGLEVLVNPDGTITLKFKIPEDSNARAYDILYWDTSANSGAGAWITLPQYKIGQPQAVSLNPGDPEDDRLITSGVKQKGEYVTVTVNFTGIFVLVAR